MRKVLIGLLAVAFANVSTSSCAAPPPSIQVSDATCVEGQSCNFAVKLVGTKSRQSTTATYSVTPGTAQAGTDYTSKSGSLTLSASSPTVTVAIPTINNTKVDGPRTFTLKIVKGSNARCSDCTALGTINDNDVAPTPTPTPTPEPTPAPEPTPTPTPTPTPSDGWVTAPLQFGGYARLKVSTKGWPKLCGTTYNYTNIYRTAQAGEVFQVDGNAGLYADCNGRKYWKVNSLVNKGDVLYFFDDELEGVAPVAP